MFRDSDVLSKILCQTGEIHKNRQTHAQQATIRARENEAEGECCTEHKYAYTQTSACLRGHGLTTESTFAL